MKKILLIMVLLLTTVNSYAAYTANANVTFYNKSYLFDGALGIGGGNINYPANGFWLSTDLGVNSLIGSLTLYNSGVFFPSSFSVYTSPSSALTVADVDASTWTLAKTMSGINPPTQTFITVGFDAPVTARAIKIVFPPASGSTFLIGELSFSAVTQASSSVFTADTFTALNAIKADTSSLLTGISDVKVLVSSGGSFGGSPLDASGSAASQAVPQDLQALIKPTDFAFASGLTGMLCAYAMILIWSRGL